MEEETLDSKIQNYLVRITEFSQAHLDQLGTDAMGLNQLAFEMLELVRDARHLQDELEFQKLLHKQLLDLRVSA